MERLADLPPANTEMSPDEKNVMNKFFGDGNAVNEPDSTKKPSWKETMKSTMIAAGLFILFANPLIDGILCRLPYCGDNGLTLLVIKTLLFMILFIAVNRFL